MKTITYLIILLMSGLSFATDGEEVVLRGVGATFPNPLYQRWTEIYKESTDRRVIYQPVGSSEGINQLMNRQVDFGGTDAFIPDMNDAPPDEQILHIPTCIGAIVLSYNLPGNPSLLMDSGVISAIFLGQITNWSDRAIRKLNPNVSLPDLPITVLHRSDGSGTTFIFTSYLEKKESQWRDTVGAGKKVVWKTGLGLEGNSKVAEFNNKIEGSIAYIEWTYAVQNNLKFAALKNKSGNFIQPSQESISYAADIDLPADLKIMLLDTTDPVGYPICGFTYLIFYAEQSYGGRTIAQAEALENWLWWITHEGQEFNQQLHYAPLPAIAIKHEERILRQMRFNGKAITHTIEANNLDQEAKKRK